MELYLLKIINFFIEPINILSLILLTLVFTIFFINSKKLIIFFSKLLLIIFLFFSYTPLSDFILKRIEDYIQPSKFPAQQLKGVIVLGGSFNSGLQSKERNEVSINSSAERLTKTLEIYKKNQSLLIIFSGFSNEVSPKGWSESDMAKKFFLDQGVSINNLIFENKSRNTFENIQYSKDLISNYKGVWGLITSASHMPRSFFAFKKQGIILEPIHTDYMTGNSKIFWINFDIDAGLNSWKIIFHELVAGLYYKVTNKI
jgi:uncharacterized SAM-binding protein YcdF (DUF218 family)